MHKVIGTIVGVVALLTLAAPAYAGDDNKNGHGGSAPDASVALILPAAGAAALGARAFLRKSRPSK